MMIGAAAEPHPQWAAAVSSIEGNESPGHCPTTKGSRGHTGAGHQQEGMKGWAEGQEGQMPAAFWSGVVLLCVG